VASVRVEVVVGVPAAQVWAAIADVGAVHERLLPGRVQVARMDGDVRILTMPDGTEVRELIVAVDPVARRMAYAVVGGQRMALAHHHASFEVLDHDAPGRCRLVWLTDVLPHTLEPQVRARVERGIAEMRDVLEAAAGPPD
jgi:uncharacterized protein YndB with AHSA1/START domain